MTDKLSPERRSKNMAAIRGKDTKPELIVRRLVHRLGYRYRLHRKDLQGKPDIVLGPRGKLIFVHGCFWHGCERENCLDARRPKSNTGYWNSKIDGNRMRDERNRMSLTAAGWGVLVIWDCETRDIAALQQKIERFLGPIKADQTRP